MTVAGDGNCYFSSVSEVLYGTLDFNALVRSKIVRYVMDNPALFLSSLPKRSAGDEVAHWCRGISNEGEDCDEICLAAASLLFQFSIHLINSGTSNQNQVQQLLMQIVRSNLPVVS